MFKSSRRDRTEGTMDRIGGRILEAIGRMTGRTSYKVKGKAARARGETRRGKGRVKRAVH
jgi:uncharacterized protein YjbJ (UPF0337 family)